MSDVVEKLGWWHAGYLRPFLAEHLPDKLPGIEEALTRIRTLNTVASEELAICFLGASGVGKSTLINALVAGSEFVLPSTGMGPLTAVAMEVRYGTVPAFEAEYHPAGTLWQRIGFPLERNYAGARKSVETGAGKSPSVGSEFGQATEEEEVADTDDDESRRRLEGLRKQAQLLIKGSQDTYSDVPYLVDSLREASGMKRVWGTPGLPEDQQRMSRLREALALAKMKKKYRCELSTNSKDFQSDLDDHATGFIAPLIKELHVRWHSSWLREGTVLVDLPGVGVAGDVYKAVTRDWVNKRAKAVVLVVDRAGITEASADLLQSSDFLTRLLFSADARADDPVILAVAMTRLDDNAEALGLKDKTRKKFEHLADQFDRAPALVRAQLRQQLDRLKSGDETVQKAQDAVIDQLCRDVLVFPVSAPQYRCLLADDPGENPFFIKTAEQSGIPAMQRGLSGIVNDRRKEALRRQDEAIEVWLNQARTLVEMVQARWAADDRSEREVRELQQALEQFLGPRRKEFLVRQGQFREFLKKTMEERIRALVMSAKESARKEIRRYLVGLKGAHWGTLRAAVRREGVFYGAKHINLPDDFARKFVEPVAEVWGKSILQEIRKRTREFAGDCERMVSDLADWCRGQGAQVSANQLDKQLENLRLDIKQIEIAGREIINGLRDRVKNELAKAIQAPIRKECVAFVKKGDSGYGIKGRILELFDELSEECTDAAAKAAEELLLTCFKEVELELQQIRKDLENPLDEAADSILEAHRRRIEKSDSKKRENTLKACDALLGAIPSIAATPMTVGAVM
jgi:hypothetical protein